MNKKYTTLEDALEWLIKEFVEKDTQIMVCKLEKDKNDQKIEKMHVDLSKMEE